MSGFIQGWFVVLSFHRFERALHSFPDWTELAEPSRRRYGMFWAGMVFGTENRI